jgi:hypothetical protein
MKECRIVFSDEFAKRKALILQIKKSTATSRIVIYDVERTETASQALPALKAITTISASTRMHRCLYAVGWDRGAEEG